MVVYNQHSIVEFILYSGEYAMPQRRRRTFMFAALKSTKYGQNIANSSNHQEYLITDGFFNDVFPVNKPDSAKIKKNRYQNLKIFLTETLQNAK